MPNVILHDEALGEFRQATRWYEFRTPGVGERYADAVEKVIVEVGEQPDRFPRLDRVFREAGMTDYPYSVIYRALPSGDVQVVAIAHASREPGYWRGRA